MRALLAAALLSVAAADPPVHVVRVDAVATDARGAAVPNLEAGDFDVREDGTPQSIDEARFVAGGGENGRLFAIYLDEYHVTAGANANRARAALTDFFDREVGLHDQFVVMKPLDSLLAIHLAPDVDEARRIVAAFEGRKGDYAPRTPYERNYMAGAPARVEAARMQVTLSALNALALHLGSLSDLRKSLIVVTEGLEPAERRRGDALPTLNTVVRSANRARVSIYPLDPRPSRDAADAATLRSLANDTDGQVIASDGDLASAASRIAADSSGYYLLTYRASHAEDGAFHRVQVKVSRAGVQLRARSGFWAPSAEEAVRAAALARADAPAPARLPILPTHVSPLIRPWFGLSRGSDGKTRVTFVWEPAGRVPGDRGGPSPARLVVTAFAADGAVLFDGPVMPTGPGVPGSTAAPGVPPIRAMFESVPGRVRLQMKVQSAAAQDLDTDVRDIVVRDLRAAVSIGTPEVLRARNAREFRALDLDGDAAPVASREFSRTERLLIRFPVYAPDEARTRLAAKLKSRMGQAMRDLVVERTPDGERQIDMPLAGLAAGEYLIEVTATSPAGEVKDLVNFRVTS
jgi:VWFA-related protein